MASVVDTSARLSRSDLTARQMVVAAFAAMAAVTALDLLDGRLGLLFSVGFVLIAGTMPLSVDVRELLPSGVLPPVLLVVTIAVVCAVMPSAIVVDGLPADAGWLARTLGGAVDHGVTLLIGHALAVTSVVARILTDPDHPRRT